MPKIYFHGVAKSHKSYEVCDLKLLAALEDVTSSLLIHTVCARGGGNTEGKSTKRRVIFFHTSLFLKISNFFAVAGELRLVVLHCEERLSSSLQYELAGKE